MQGAKRPALCLRLFATLFYPDFTLGFRFT